MKHISFYLSTHNFSIMSFSHKIKKKSHNKYQFKKLVYNHKFIIYLISLFWSL